MFFLRKRSYLNEKQVLEKDSSDYIQFFSYFFFIAERRKPQPPQLKA
jgi:hypothetical protein